MKDKVVVITGGTSGIGRALAATFGKHGSKVFITGRNQEALDKTVAELSAEQIIVRGILADAASEADNKRMIETVIAAEGRLDVMICNAGISMRALFEEVTLDAFRKVMDINFYGTVYATKYALPHLLASSGSLVGISSINGRRSTPARSAYSASKFAMEGFMETIRTEVMDRGVHVLSVCPGFTASEIRKKALNAEGQQQLNSPREESSLMSAEEVAGLVYRAVIARKRDLVITLQGKVAVWLNKLFPALADRIVYNVMKKEAGSPVK
ncbi:MAG: SDR family oxidoreductase [Bacteroidota bacterium]